MEKKYTTIILDKLVLSKTMNKYLKDSDYDLTDLQWLNLIIHNYKNITDLLDLLRLLQHITKSKQLIKYIDRLLECEMNAINDFKTNTDKKCIYEINTIEYDYKLHSILECEGYANDFTTIKNVINRLHSDNVIINKLKLITSCQKEISKLRNYVGTMRIIKNKNIYCETEKYNFYKIMAHTDYDVNIFVPHPFKYRDRVIDINSKRRGYINSSTNNIKWYDPYEYEDTCFSVKFDNEDTDEYINIFNLEKEKDIEKELKEK